MNVLHTTALSLLSLLLCLLSGAIHAEDAAQPPAATPLEVDDANPAPNLPQATKPAPETLPFDSLRTFADVFGRIKSDFVETVSDKTLIENAIRGMLSGLDPHSSYLNEEEYQELNITTTGQFGGLGIEVGMTKDGYIEVISPIDDTPAQQAGIQAGDVILRLDGTSVKGMSLDEAVKRMRGEVGSKIVLTLERKGRQNALEIILTRAIIKVASVKSVSLGEGFGYIRIGSFQADTVTTLLKALETLSAGQALKGLVLDLRNNPGGILSAAVGVSDAFLTQGLIVYTEGRTEEAVLKFEATPTDYLAGSPLVVLVNGGSASASEIVAGALQDHKRAIIMGSKTFGKGSVQTILPLTNNKAVKLTTARYFTPLGRSIQAQGILPDIALEPRLKLVDHNTEESPTQPLTEANLSGHLDNSQSQTPSQNTKPEPSPPPESSTPANSSNSSTTLETWVKNDVAVREAFNLLKGLSILRKVE